MKIKHTPGVCPVAYDVKVRVWLRNKTLPQGEKAKAAQYWDWGEHGTASIEYYERETEVTKTTVDNAYDNYTFNTEGFDTINFQKIMDDLSYADPLRIVEFADSTFAVVHHTILDKAKRSSYVRDHMIPLWIKIGSGSIDKSEISGLIEDIRAIKKSEWSPITEHNLEVKVSKVNV